jgi:hypothetical protein
MFRHVACVVIALAAAVPAMAQSAEKPVRLAIHPAAAAIPALRYQLLPQVEDLSPGNRALLYYRSFSPEWEAWRRQQGLLDQLDRALHAPLNELPRKELDWVLQSNQFREVDLAARREYIDWELTSRVRSEGIGMLLPDMQSLRLTANMLALRARLEIADQHYDKALYTLQTGYALGQDLGDAPLLISALVGVAICTQMSKQVEELIQAPGSPNLYWALTALPRPMVSLRKPLQGERMIVYTELPDLREIETTRFSSQQQQALVEHVLRLVAIMRDDRPVPSGANWEGRLELTALVAKLYPEAKRALVAQRRKPLDVEGLPALQVVLIHALHQYQRLQDDLFKCFNLPYWQALPELAKADQQITAAKCRLEAEPLLGFLPTISKVYTTTTRLDRRIAALRCVEAIRLYAAAHDGKLPAALSDITEVPVPIDPMTGNRFAYKVDGNKASLSAAAPPGLQYLPENALAYDLILER